MNTFLTETIHELFLYNDKNLYFVFLFYYQT